MIHMTGLPFLLDSFRWRVGSCPIKYIIFNINFIGKEGEFYQESSYATSIEKTGGRFECAFCKVYSTIMYAYDW